MLDGHPAEFRLGAGDGEGDDTHHHGTWRIAKVFEGATEQFVSFPVGFLACETEVVDVFAAGAELAWLGTNSTQIAGGCHDAVYYQVAGTMG